MKEIGIYEAERELAKRVAKRPIEDAVYELAFEVVQKIILEMEGEFCIVDIDGLPCMSDSGNDGCWYDDVRDEMMQDVYEKVKRFLTGE